MVLISEKRNPTDPFSFSNALIGRPHQLQKPCFTALSPRAIFTGKLISVCWNSYFNMKIFLGVVTRIRPSDVAAIPRGLGKWVILFPVKRPSRENCWTRWLSWSHTKRQWDLFISKPYGLSNCPSWLPRLPNLCKNVPDLSKALMQWFPLSDMKTCLCKGSSSLSCLIFLGRCFQRWKWSLLQVTSPVSYSSQTRLQQCDVLHPNKHQKGNETLLFLLLFLKCSQQFPFGY